MLVVGRKIGEMFTVGEHTLKVLPGERGRIRLAVNPARPGYKKSINIKGETYSLAWLRKGEVLTLETGVALNYYSNTFRYARVSIDAPRSVHVDRI